MIGKFGKWPFDLNAYVLSTGRTVNSQTLAVRVSSSQCNYRITLPMVSPTFLSHPLLQRLCMARGHFSWYVPDRGFNLALPMSLLHGNRRGDLFTGQVKTMHPYPSLSFPWIPLSTAIPPSLGPAPGVDTRFSPTSGPVGRLDVPDAVELGERPADAE